jgi:hypothetical protein
MKIKREMRSDNIEDQRVQEGSMWDWMPHGKVDREMPPRQVRKGDPFEAVDVTHHTYKGDKDSIGKGNRKRPPKGKKY